MVAEQDFARIRSTLAHALGLMLLLNLPATIGLIVLARPIVAVIFEHGNFTAADTIATAAALQLYAIGLIGYSVVRIISPTFYAVGRSRIPVMVSAGSVAVNVVLNVALVRAMGYRGLALGTSITAIVNASVQLVLLRREIHGLEGSRIAASLARVAAASAVMGAVTWGVHMAMLDALPGSTLTLQVLRLLVTIGVSLAALAGVAQLLRIREFAEARDLVLGRLKRMAG
jgi:putative peptidoglycan lipid II flippase